jgi:hypothetical protein
LNGSSKTLRLLLVVVMIAGLVMVAIPVCAVPACAESSSGTPGMASHAVFPGASHSALSAVFTGFCDMAVTVQTTVDSLLPAAASGLLLGLGAALALIAATGLVLSCGWTPRRAAAAFARILSPPGDLRGVRLLI